MRRVRGERVGFWLLVYFVFIWVVVYLMLFRLGGSMIMLKVLFHLFLTFITGGLWLVVLLVNYLVRH